MAERDPQALRAALVQLLGEGQVAWDDETLRAHAHDTWPLALLRDHQERLNNRPACVVSPTSTADVATVLGWANQRRVAVVPFGGGSGVGGGVLPDGDAIVVELTRMDQLLELNETAVQARVQAGMFGHKFEEALQARGYTMGHWPQSVALSTVGGWVATRAAGQYSTRYGSIEDMLMGLEAVLADGRVVRVKATPRRSAGPDPRHLFLGSEGTHGIVTEITVRVMPLPESRRLLCFSFPDFDSGLEAIRHIVRAGWRPPVVRLYDAMETGRHFGQWAGEDRCFLLVITEGPPTMTAAEAEACHAICTGHGGDAVGEQPVQHWLAERNNVPSLRSFVERGFVLDTIEVGTEWDRIHTLYHDVIEALRTVKGLIVASGHSSHSYAQGTNIYFTFVAKPEDPADAEPTYLECWRRAMEATLAVGGTICHHHGIGRLRAPYMAAEHGTAIDLLRIIKKALDPNGIMNPGALLPPE
jgi:alkyldihydroxyacetonephosphate synthase